MLYTVISCCRLVTKSFKTDYQMYTFPLRNVSYKPQLIKDVLLEIQGHTAPLTC